MQPVDSKEKYAYGTSRDLGCEKDKIKCSNIIKHYKNNWLWWCYKRKYKKT